MKKPSGFSQILIAFLAISGVLFAFNAYQDAKAKEKHDIAKNDVMSVVNAIASHPKIDGMWHNAQLVVPETNSTGASENVINLPEDGANWYVTVIERAGETSSRLLGYFEYDPRLNRLKNETHFNVYTTNSKMYLSKISRWAGDVVPCVIIQDGNGKAVYKASGANIPSTASEMADNIATVIGSYKSECPDCRPFRPKPNPTPAPTPLPTPAPNPIPDITPNNPPPPPEDESLNPLTLGLIAVAVGAGVYLIGSIRSTLKL